MESHSGPETAKIDRVIALMGRHDVDYLVATSPENIFYLTGYMPFQGVWNRFPKAALVSRESGSIWLVLPINEVGFAVDTLQDDVDLRVFGHSNFSVPVGMLDAEERRIDELAGRADSSLLDGLAAIVGSTVSARRKIAVDQTGAPEVRDRLAERLPQHVVTGGGEDLWRLARMVKTDSEIERLSAAIRVNEAGIAAVHASLATSTERELARIFHAAVGAAGGHVQHWIGASDRRAGAYRTGLPHTAQRGDRFRYDCGVAFNGYCSDLGGTSQIGAKPSAKERDTYKALTAGIEIALREARPGLATSALYGKVLDAIRGSGLPDYRHTMVGHGIGVEPRDLPIIGPPMKTSSPFLPAIFDPVLEVGMVLNVECPIIQLGAGGFQHEVTMVVEHGGARLISSLRDYRVV